MPRINDKTRILKYYKNASQGVFLLSESMERANEVKFNQVSSTLSPIRVEEYWPVKSFYNKPFAYSSDGTISYIRRITFQTGSSSSRQFAVTSRGRKLMNNMDYGWYSPISSYSNIDRIDWNNDTIAPTARGSIAECNTMPAGHFRTSDGCTYGWYGGGCISSGYGTLYSSIFRLDYNNDLAAPSVRGKLSQTATGISDFGTSNMAVLFAGSCTQYGSDTQQRLSGGDKFIFANDLATNKTRGMASKVSFSTTVTDGKDYGWYYGSSTGYYDSAIFRFSFTNDSDVVVDRVSPSAIGSSVGKIQSSASGDIAILARANTTRFYRYSFSNDLTDVSTTVYATGSGPCSTTA